MSVFDGQPVDAAVSNPSWISKNTDDTTPSRLGLGSTIPAQGPAITWAQQELNSIDTFIGKIQNTAATATPPWTHNEVGTSTDSLFTRVTDLTQRFNGTTGHTHDGTDGNGPMIASVGSIAVSGNPPITGDVLLAPGAGVTLGQFGNLILISASGGGGGGGSYIDFPFSNNQTTPADVTGFLVSPFTNNAFEAEYSLLRRTSADPATEDTAFYTNLGTAFNHQPQGMVVQTDNKIILVGTFTTLNANTRNFIVRLNQDGTEDTAYYTNLGTGFNNSAVALAIQPSDGKAVVGGNFTSLNATTRNGLVRLNTDGTEDTAFYTNLGSAFGSGPAALAIQGDGKILVGGAFTSFNGSTRNRLVRLNTDGTEDTAFYTNLGAAFDAFVTTVVVQPDGKILVGGNFANFNGNARAKIVRLNSNGTEDVTFYTNFPGVNSTIESIVLQPSDLKILVLGTFSTFGGNSIKGIGRVNADGTEDTVYSANLGVGFDSNAFMGVITPDGGLIVGGQFTLFNGTAANAYVKILPSGLYDTAFFATLGTTGFNATVFSLLYTPVDDKILLGGTFTSFDGNTRNRLVRLANATQAEELVKQGSLRGVYRPSITSWNLGGDTGYGDDTGVSFTMTSAGQLQYVSSNLFGSAIENDFRFIINAL